MKTITPPVQHMFDLGDLSQAGSIVTVQAAPADLPQLAAWAGVEAVRSFKGIVSLRRISHTHFAFEADLEAEVVQNCVVTLEHVTSQIARHLERELQLVPHAPVDKGELTLTAGDDDVPEAITNRNYDLAAPLLEEFALAIDPYPRKGGVAFAQPAEPEEACENPFAVLKSLKERG